MYDASNAVLFTLELKLHTCSHTASDFMSVSHPFISSSTWGHDFKLVE